METVASPLLDPIRLFEVPNPLPSTYVVGQVVPASDDIALRALLDERFDLRTTAMIADGPARRSRPGFRGASRITSRVPDRIEIEVESSGPGELVLLEAYDPGWRATVDGQPTSVRRVNFGFRGVAVPAGRHVVRMWYRPPAVVAGGLMSAAALLGVLIAVVALSTSRRPAARRDAHNGS